MLFIKVALVTGAGRRAVAGRVSNAVMEPHSGSLDLSLSEWQRILDASMTMVAGSEIARWPA